MRKLFIRIYLTLFTAMFLSLVIGITVLLVSSGFEMSQSEKQYSKASHRYLLSEVEKNPGLPIDKIIKKVQPFISYDLSWVPLSELSIDEDDLQLLENGEPLFDFEFAASTAYVWVYWPLLEREGVVLYQRTQETGISDKVFIISLIVVGLLVLPISIFLFLHPIGKQLVELTRYVRRYAQGELSERLSLEGSKPFIEFAADLNTMADQIEKQMNNQHTMSNAISHELKTPLTRLRMENDMAQMTDNHDDLKDYVTSVAEDLEQLEKLIKSILTLARYTHKSQQLELDAVDLRALLRQVVEQYVGQDVEIQLNIKDDIVVESNSDGLSHILINIIGNAVRYTHKQVCISASIFDGFCHLYIDDDGPGIPEDQRKNIFNAFSLLDDSRSRDLGGTGLGLAIVDAIAQKINCEVIVGESTFGGARFEVILSYKHQE